MISATMFFVGLLQALVILAVAPLFSGFSRVMRAKMHNRRGPSIFQNYRDIVKLMKRQEVVSEQAGWVFRATPYITIVSMLLIAAIIPVFTSRSPFEWVGDLILVVYLYALSRFFFSVSGLETGSTFGGMGGRRELLISALIEPVMLLVLFVMALLAGSTNLGVISTKVATGQIPLYTSVWLGMLAFAFASFVEMGKLPFDLAEAEQELQEGPLTEFSGKSLALMKWGIYMKQVVLVALFVSVFLPFGSVTATSLVSQLWISVLLAVVIFFAKAFLLYFIVAVLENAMARVRFLKASAVTWTALGAAILSFVFYLANV
ncbi:MAG: hydrogenase [Chloroflexi bacterium]|nr:hydrogenase [Chloroflexota bacterium]